MENWQKWVLTVVFVSAGIAGAWFFFGDKNFGVVEPTSEINMEPVEGEEGQ